MILEAVLAAVLAADTPAPRPAPPADFATAARDGKAALDAGDAAAAIAAYESARAARPESAEAAYNLGVALYRGGKFREAADAFKQAASIASNGERTNASLSNSSLFNRAASFYGATRAQAEAAQRMIDEGTRTDGEPQAPPVDPEALKQAIDDAKESLRSFKDAAWADERDLESRANAEQASRLVRALEELRRKQEQDNQQQQEKRQDDQQERQPSKDDEKQDQQGDDRKPEKPDDSRKDQDSKDQRDQGKDGERKKPEDQQQQQDQQQDKQQDKQQDDPAEQQKQPAPRNGEMTKDEADRLLQAVRDREQKRRAEQERRAEQQAKSARGRKPIKDW